MTKRILLVSSSFEEISLITASSKQKTGRKLEENVHYPLGLAYLHSYLESLGHEIKTLFLNAYNYEACFKAVIETIGKFLPEIIGFQIMSCNRVSTYRLIEYIHLNHPDIQILIGGVHSTIMYKQLIERFPYLIAVLGEGEVTTAELVKELSDQDPNLRKVDGIAFYDGNSVITTNPRMLIENLDELPFPKHEIFFNETRVRGNILTTRGCPFSCSFCCLAAISKRRVRKRSVKNVIEEIEWMVSKFPQMTTIWIHDDSFFLDNERVIEFCDEIIKREIKVKFICSGRVKPLSQKMVSKLEQANFVMVLLGLESGDEGILKSCHKAITQADVINAFQLFSKSKIILHVFLMVGLPGENLETIMETVRFMKKLQKIKYVYYNEDIAILTVYPGTEVYEIAKAGGMINDDYWLSGKPCPLFTQEYSQEQLFRFKDILLSHLSLDRFFTATGFKEQFAMLPYIIKFIFKNVRFIFDNKAEVIKIFFKLLKKNREFS